MSHFSVLIVLPAGTPPERIEQEIDRRMERWNEGRTVEAYRKYEEGAPEDYWWVISVRRGADEHRQDAPVEIRPSSLVDGEDKVYRNGAGYVTRAEYVQMEKDSRADDAVWAERLGEHPTWKDLVRLYNEKYHPGNEVALLGDDGDSDALHYDPESGRAYQMSTYNPESMWDYWRIGGRWGGYFKVKESGPGLIAAHASWDSPKEAKSGLRADGAPKQLIDFDGMRDEAAVKASAEFDKWDAACAGTAVARSWPEMVSLVEVGELTIDQARREYQAQPRIQAARVSGIDDWECPVETFKSGREEYISEARRAAVPGYALVTLDEEWIAPGRMGWFGMSSDQESERSGYRIAVNNYLADKVADDDLVIALDCHI